MIGTKTNHIQMSSMVSSLITNYLSYYCSELHIFLLSVCLVHDLEI